MTARRAHVYPQVDARAAGLIDLRVAPCPERATVAEALTLLRKRNVQALARPARKGLVLLEDLTRAGALGLEALPAVELERTVPVVTAREGEVAVRRRLLAGAAAVLVLDRLAPIGAVSRAAVRDAPGAGLSLAARLRARLPADALALLVELGRLAGAAGARAFAVGGVVRDLLIDGGPGERPDRRDIDVVVEGDGLALARRVAGALGGALTVHEAFGTASLEGLAIGRLDVATARAERYALPGALPTVRPGTIADDLERRDFTVNAMAVELASGTFELLDPLGGREDIRGRRIRVLHPLSFVEDPTRIVRAARYATRLGFALDRGTARVQALALRLAPYPALSAQRVAAEIERLLDEPAPDAALARLGAAGAFRLLDPRARCSRAVAERVAALPPAIGWTRRHDLPASPLELAALVIAAGQAAAVRPSVLRGLGFAGEPHARLLRAVETVPALVAHLGAMGAAPPSAQAAVLRDRPAIDLAWAWLIGHETGRERLDWYLDTASPIRGELGGEDLVALGVPRGPAVGLALRRLRDARLDGRAQSREDEAALVGEWTSDTAADPITRKEG